MHFRLYLHHVDYKYSLYDATICNAHVYTNLSAVSLFVVCAVYIGLMLQCIFQSLLNSCDLHFTIFFFISTMNLLYVINLFLYLSNAKKDSQRFVNQKLISMNEIICKIVLQKNYTSFSSNCIK